MIKIDNVIIEFIKIIGDKTRLEILSCLEDGQEHSVTEFQDIMKKNQSTISQQLKVLFNANLVDVRNEGRQRLYKIRDKGIYKIISLINTYLININKKKMEEQMQDIIDKDILDALL